MRGACGLKRSPAELRYVRNTTSGLSTPLRALKMTSNVGVMCMSLAGCKRLNASSVLAGKRLTEARVTPRCEGR